MKRAWRQAASRGSKKWFVGKEALWLLWGEI